MAMRIVCRHDGHCDGATPDERAPFRVWSFRFLRIRPRDCRRKQKARDFSRALVFSQQWIDGLEV
ncbi:MAG: hypothetical protein WB839_06535, partial [Pseudolabrys sp.]